jgi:tripartite-type tricarboxylate transporter receptor subunit TctC
MGHPLNAAAWLGRKMRENGCLRKAAHVVMTGALGPMVGASQGEQFTAVDAEKFVLAGAVSPRKLPNDNQEVSGRTTTMKMRMGAGIMLLVVTIGSTSGLAQPVENFYRGKTIQLTVGAAFGAGYDAYGRVLARFMSKHIPGTPTIVVQNRPVASSLQAVRYLYSIAPKDGTQLLLFNRALINLEVTNPSAVGINFRDFTWIGSMSGDVGVCYVSRATGITDANQLKGKVVKIGETSNNGGTYMYSAIASHLFGTKQVTGYGTNAQVWLAVDRGEVDGNCTGWTSIRIQRPQWINKQINVLFQYSTRRHPDLQNAPTIYELDLTPDQRRAIEFLTTADAMTRPVVAAKEVPPDRAAALREAFMKTMEDSEFISYTKQIDMDISPLSWQDAEKIVDAITSASPETVALARKITE